MFRDLGLAIINIGTSGRDDETKRRIQTINFTSATVVAILFLYNTFYIMWGDPALNPLIRIIFGGTLAFCAPIVLNKMQKTELAFYVILISSLLITVVPTAYLGTGSGIHYFIGVLIIISILGMRRGQAVFIICYILLSAGAMSYCVMQFDVGLIAPFPPLVMDLLLVNSIFWSLIMVAGALAYYRAMVLEAEVKAKEAHEKTRNILNSILPHSIAQALEVHPDQIIAEQFPNLTILFADIVSFTSRSKDLTPEEVVGRLDQVFTIFDKLAEQNGLEKIKTIGDCYMLVGGAPETSSGHADRVVQMALDMQAAAREFAKSIWPGFQIRIGIHSGSAVAGVIGRSKFAYDVWGDSVNIASRLEESCAPEEILISKQTLDMLTDSSTINEKISLDLKGRGIYEAWKVPTTPQSINH